MALCVSMTQATCMYARSRRSHVCMHVHVYKESMIACMYICSISVCPRYVLYVCADLHASKVRAGCPWKMRSCVGALRAFCLMNMYVCMMHVAVHLYAHACSTLLWVAYVVCMRMYVYAECAYTCMCIRYVCVSAVGVYTVHNKCCHVVFLYLLVLLGCWVVLDRCVVLYGVVLQLCVVLCCIVLRCVVLQKLCCVVLC